MTDLGFRILLGFQDYKSSAEIILIINTQLWSTQVAVKAKTQHSVFKLPKPPKTNKNQE